MPNVKIDRELRSTRDLLVFGLGGNLDGPWGSPRATLARAVRELAARFGPLAVAPLYRGVAIDKKGAELSAHPEYLNTVVIAKRPDTTPEEVLRHTQELERLAGRPETREIDAPRPLDIDLLLWGILTRRDADPVIPHPRMRERRFVLRPLVDLAPHLILPPDGARASELLERLGEAQRIERVEEDL